MKIADVSVYQDTINWEKARQELELVIFRASIGMNSDKKYHTYAAECGIPFGVYHYFKAGNAEDAKKEATFFYNNAIINDLKPLFFCLDIEYSTQTSSTTKIVCETARDTLKKLGAKKIGLYIGQSRYPYIKDIIDTFDFIWIPRYGKDTGYANEAYKPIYPCDIWQYTSKGSVAGIKTNVDLNQLCGNKDLNWYLSESEVSQKRVLFYLGYRTIRKGKQGRDVKELQEILNELGFNCGKADGIFGNMTKNAVMAFQAANGLEVDGICGPKTVQKIIG